jgi:hypothetical protein
MRFLALAILFSIALPLSALAENVGTPAPPAVGQSSKPTLVRPCKRICVKPGMGGSPAAPAPCLQWKTVC